MVIKPSLEVGTKTRDAGRYMKRGMYATIRSNGAALLERDKAPPLTVERSPPTRCRLDPRAKGDRLRNRVRILRTNWPLVGAPGFALFICSSDCLVQEEAGAHSIETLANAGAQNRPSTGWDHQVPLQSTVHGVHCCSQTPASCPRVQAPSGLYRISPSFGWR